MLKRKVLMVLHLPAPIHGAAMVGKFINESQLINSSFDADYINLSTSTNLKQIGRGGVKKLCNFLEIQFKVVRALFSKQYDLVYMTLTATGPGFYKDFLVIALLKVFRVKILYHFHNKGVSVKQNNWIDDLLYRFAFNNTQSILLSSRLYSDIKKYVKKEDVFFCANGIPENAEVPSNNKGIGVNNSPCRILYLSNMMATKGVFVLLESCKILRENGLEFECHFVGDWCDISEEVFITYVETNNLNQYVFAHGKKYGKDKHRFFSNTDIFVFPSYYDTFGLVNLEAMEFGIPIISTYEGGIPDVVLDGETGFLVPQKNAAALAEKIEVLIKQPELRLQLGMAGKRRFKNLYTLEKFEKNFVKVLNQALHNNNNQYSLETSDVSYLKECSNTRSLTEH